MEGCRENPPEHFNENVVIRGQQVYHNRSELLLQVHLYVSYEVELNYTLSF